MNINGIRRAAKGMSRIAGITLIFVTRKAITNPQYELVTPTKRGEPQIDQVDVELRPQHDALRVTAQHDAIPGIGLRAVWSQLAHMDGAARRNQWS